MAVVDIKEAKTVPDSGVVECLEKLLEDAKSGDIRTLAVAATRKNGCYIRVITGADLLNSEPNIQRALGALAILERDLLALVT